VHDKYGSDAGEDDGSSTSYSSEDSEAELATPAVDAAILKTLARIKRGDAAIYEAGRDIFSGALGSRHLSPLRTMSAAHRGGESDDDDDDQR
jgi:hypothetical protein